VRLEEADRREERLGRVAGEEVDSLRRDELDVRPADAPDVVVAEHVDIVGDVLLADQLRVVAGSAQRVDHVLRVVEQLESAMREPDHAVAVRVLTRHQARAAARAARRRGERLAEQDPLVREQLDVGGRDEVPVRLHIATGVVRVQVDDVRLVGHAGTSSPWSSTSRSRP
jgi:hypothetical protein